MRVIKFRGVTPHGKYVFGDLIHTETGVAIRPFGDYAMPFGYRVLPESVAQFTGLKDAIGQEIYEDSSLVVYYRIDVDNPDETFYKVKWDNANTGYAIVDSDGDTDDWLDERTSKKFVAVEPQKDRKDGKGV